ncbi:MAG TPA: sugar-binding transcriptional regulator [Anaerolineaceae bacterium]|jgi:DNA-binding transcriptional regulator LsrR (DeoR family)|nr:sugar-binding transcriptional regulator [Anaerolineaceae bacterium]HOE34177.1 sugar-binding transcriptional regulator [Anaerolineaceae bacterium]HQL26958.1 sugar-binding transcriptional regulator [Anaerolineaceae bacterium]
MSNFNQGIDQKKIARLELLAEVASMYYEQQLTQAEIADQLFISRSRISRLIAAAHKEGIISIKVHHFGERAYEIEELLKRCYHLKEAIVVNNLDKSTLEILNQMATFGARYIDSQIDNIKIIGVSWGRSLSATIDALKGSSSGGREIVQIIGGTLNQSSGVDIARITQKLIAKYNATGIYMNAPLFVDNPKVAEELRQQSCIRTALEKARSADLILTGVGAVKEEAIPYLWAGYEQQHEYRDLLKCGAEGFICAQFYDIDGREVCSEVNDRVIGIRLKELREVKQVIAIAGGAQKSAAVLGGLRGGYFNVLITDQSCIDGILAIAPRFLQNRKKRH